MPREVVYCLIFIALMLVALAWFCFPQSPTNRAHWLGQELLMAAQERNWSKAKELLDEGADPDVTQLDPSQLQRHSLYSFLGLAGSISSLPPSVFKRPSALQQAIYQDDIDAVKLLLDHHATIDTGALGALRVCGDRAIITCVEDAAHVPPEKRSLPTAPFAPGAAGNHENVIPGTIGAGPTSHFLWLSPHELILSRGMPPSFTALDLNTNVQAELPDLTNAWADQPEFDPDMLALSPDGQWLLGFGGTAAHPRWRATQVHGTGVQEWDRVAQPGPKMRFRIEGHPLIAWRDNTRWMEINTSPNGDVVRLRTLGSPATQEVPLVHQDYGYLGAYTNELFSCPDPDHAFLRGNVGVTNSPATGPQYVVFMAGFTAEAGSWQEEKRGFNVSAKAQPGFAQRCVPSPDGKRLAWLKVFAGGFARDILLSDADGTHFRIVVEHLASPRAGPTHWVGYRGDMPNARSLDWTPDGSRLIYWRGDKGEGGLCLLPVSGDE
jgi:hypothetical protein